MVDESGVGELASQDWYSKLEHVEEELSGTGERRVTGPVVLELNRQDVNNRDQARTGIERALY